MAEYCRSFTRSPCHGLPLWLEQWIPACGGIPSWVGTAPVSWSWSHIWISAWLQIPILRTSGSPPVLRPGFPIVSTTACDSAGSGTQQIQSYHRAFACTLRLSALAHVGCIRAVIASATSRWPRGSGEAFRTYIIRPATGSPSTCP